MSIRGAFVMQCISFLLLCSLCSCVCSLVAAKEYASVSSRLDRSALQVACIHSLLKVSQGRHQDPGLLSGRSVKNPHPGPFWFLVNTSLLHLLKLKSSFPCGLAAGVTLSSQSPPHVLAIDLTLLTRIRFSRVTSVLLLAPSKDLLD